LVVVLSAVRTSRRSGAGISLAGVFVAITATAGPRERLNRTYFSGVERSECNISIDNIARFRGLKVKPYLLLDDSVK
jgi:hypothetical protein